MSNCFLKEKCLDQYFLLIFFFCSLYTSETFSQIELNDLNYGSYQTSSSDNYPTIHFDNFKSKQTAKLDNSGIIQLIQQNYPAGVTIQFSDQIYEFQKPIITRSNLILRGEGKKTVFKFTMDKPQHLIQIRGHLATTKLPIKPAIEHTISYSLTHQIKAKIDTTKCWIYVRPDDEKYVFSDWAKGCSGQIISATYKDGTFYLDQPILERILKSVESIQLFDMIGNVGIENMTIINNSPAANPQERFSNILLEFAQNCWIYDVQSEWCNYAHVQVDKSTHCSVRRLQAKNAFNHGSGGVGYGVVLQYAASQNLVDSCTFDSLRHAMLLQIGAKFNKLDANTSTHPFWTGNFYRKNRASDITFHGNYPEFNLITNNIVNTIAFDRSHGLNGPHNSILNNRITAYGIFISRKSSEDGQLIENNVICKKGRLKSRGNHLIRGNRKVKCTN